MNKLNYMWLIALKDLKIFAKDRAAVFFFIIFPFLFILMFYFLNLGAAEDERLTFHLATLEPEGGLSHEIIGTMETTDESKLQAGDPVIVWERDYDEAYRKVEEGELPGFIAFPADFTRGVVSGSGTRLMIIADSGAVYEKAALDSIADSLASQVGAEQIVINASVALLVEGGIIPPDEESINQAARQILAEISAGQDGTGGTLSLIGFAEPERVGDIEAGNPADYVIPGYLVMFVFFAAAVAAESIVRERQNNTLERLLTSSVSKGSILGGIYIGTLLRGFIQILIFWAVGILFFKVDLGLSPVAVIILSVLLVIMSAAFAVMLATLAKTQRSAGSLATVTALILAPLGGCWWPLFILPEWLQTIAKISPHAWANTGFNKLMLFGADFASVVPEMIALVVFTAIFGVIAVMRFRTSAV
jgi:ABC-2 type transport system permease protein